jgi:hypothetical protein
VAVKEFTLSGYDDRKELLAQRYNRAGKSLFVIALPLHLIPTHMPIPDPAKPFEGNRTVNVKHASEFGEYWRANVKWAVPPLLLDTTFPLAKDFEPSAAVAGVEFGVVKLPHNSAGELQILDGQHRILGWTIISNRIAEETRAAREKALRARELDDPLSLQIAQSKVDELARTQERLRQEYVTVEILEGVSLDDHKQYFHDIAVNAKGITKSLTTSFDRRSLINRVAMELAGQHRLLVDLVDFETDRVAGRNENFVSGRNLADIIKAVAVGVGGQLTKRKEDAFKEATIQQMVEQFLDALVESFPQLDEVASGELHPVDLRDKSLLGSATILRTLAGAYHLLAVDKRDEENPYVATAGDKKARELFEALADRMTLPIEPAWFDTGYFPEPTSKAPSSRSQDLKGLTALLARWGETGKVLESEGARRGSAAADAWA